ncbi:MAG: type I-E CRISPR-associated protein Cse2/CasB [Methylococcales bacterium]|nr:type I-E CRISPR-associated protein Cse2/CasB [Methylococcales bacterium]
MNPLIEFLMHGKDDRGKMATLRKGLIAHQAQYTWPLLNPFGGVGNQYNARVIQTIAGLFAHHPNNTDKGNFGDLCRELLDDDEIKKMKEGKSGPISKHFQYVLAADGEEIFARVSRLVRRAKRDDIPVNYQQLLDDLSSWNSYRKEGIKTRWGLQFWTIHAEESTDAEISED